MKYLLPCILLLSLSACKKKGCYQCISRTYQNSVQTRTDTTAVCDKTDDEISEYAKNNTTTNTIPSTPPVTVRKVTTCN